SKIFRSYDQLPEYLICLLFSGFGLAVLASASDLTSFFLGIETLSIAIYCLCGFYRTDLKSTESGLKYLLISVFSTVILLYGISMIYGATGSTSYSVIAREIGSADPTLALLGLVFLIGAIAFKLALVPFH